jgi:hypothetical protein
MRVETKTKLKQELAQLKKKLAIRHQLLKRKLRNLIYKQMDRKRNSPFATFDVDLSSADFDDYLRPGLHRLFGRSRVWERYVVYKFEQMQTLLNITSWFRFNKKEDTTVQLICKPRYPIEMKFHRENCILKVSFLVQMYNSYGIKQFELGDS